MRRRRTTSCRVRSKVTRILESLDRNESGRMRREGGDHNEFLAEKSGAEKGRAKIVFVVGNCTAARSRMVKRIKQLEKRKKLLRQILTVGKDRRENGGGRI